MKKLFIICSYLLLAFFVNAQTKKHADPLLNKAKLNVQKYIKSDALLPNSYMPVSWSKLSAMYPVKNTSIFDKTGNTDIDSKIDSVNILEFALFPDDQMYFTLLHTFKLKMDYGQQTKLYVYSIRLNKNMNIVAVDKSDREEQIEKNKTLIQQINKKERLIREINAMKIKAMKTRSSSGIISKPAPKT